MSPVRDTVQALLSDAIQLSYAEVTLLSGPTTY
jgi:hypothetical protein